MNGTMTMTIENSGDESGPGPGEGAGPSCPFCGQRWSQAMLDALEEATVHHGCACCPEPGAVAAKPVPVSTRDIACDSCGRALFRAVAPGGAA